MTRPPEPLPPRERALLQQLVAASDPSARQETKILQQIAVSASDGPGWPGWLQGLARLGSGAHVGLALGGVAAAAVAITLVSTPDSSPNDTGAAAGTHGERTVDATRSHPRERHDENGPLATPPADFAARRAKGAIIDADAPPQPKPTPAHAATETRGAAPARPHAEATAPPYGRIHAGEPAPTTATDVPQSSVRTEGPSELESLRIATRHVQAREYASALAALRQADTSFPKGMFAEERSVLRAEVLCKQGNTRQARGEIRTFVTANPRSPLRRRMEDACP